MYQLEYLTLPVLFLRRGAFSLVVFQLIWLMLSCILQLSTSHTTLKCHVVTIITECTYTQILLITCCNTSNVMFVVVDMGYILHKQRITCTVYQRTNSEQTRLHQTHCRCARRPPQTSQLSRWYSMIYIRSICVSDGMIFIDFFNYPPRFSEWPMSMQHYMQEKSWQRQSINGENSSVNV